MEACALKGRTAKWTIRTALRGEGGHELKRQKKKDKQEKCDSGDYQNAVHGAGTMIHMKTSI